MDIRQLVKQVAGPIPVIGVCALLLVSLSYFIILSLNENAPAQLQFWITVTGGIGITTLLFFLLVNCISLYRQFARNELGSRLTIKLVLIFLLLTTIPFALIYYFSIQFLNKGVNSWFDVKVEQTVRDARFLGEAWLNGVQTDIRTDVENFANSLAADIATGDLHRVLNVLDEVRELEGYLELSIHTDDGRILAFNHADQDRMMPDLPVAEVFVELRIPQTYVSLEPLNDQTQQIRVVAPITLQRPNASIYALQAIKLLPLNYSNLASSVEQALTNYDQMVFSRGPLRFSLILTLSLISLASLLFSMLAAVYLSKRLVAPISNLAAGTKKISEGDYGTHLPVTSKDELGILTDSFNHMSTTINSAQQAAQRSQHETERQKSYLEAVLTNLSSGVMSFDQERRLQVCNSAAIEILGMQEQPLIGLTTMALAGKFQPLSRFIQCIQNGLDSQQVEWADEVTILGARRRQVLIMRGTRIQTTTGQNSDLPASETDNTVVVFDDVTNLIQAQRDAAWGEVARRLAHEIKNPLTPIQLSAERIHSKFSDQVDPALRETLERSTRTIVEQVESMKEMVNAFSSYAQPVRATLEPLNLNQLIRDVVELHVSTLGGVDVNLDLDDSLPLIKANSSALRQVLNNLIINASHAMQNQKEAKLEICSSAAPQGSGHYVDLVISDNGLGVPPEIRESLFDPYVSSKAKGSGLGLAIVKRIVEEHSGSVWAGDSRLINSQSNHGTALHLRLPINALQTYRGNRLQNPLHSAQG